jgi:DNA-binding response OmpR family regulator
MTDRLMIVEDNKATLMAMEAYFSKKNYHVTIAENGLEGLKLFNQEGPAFDLLITDIVMPEIGGVALISIIKKKFPGMPIIAITGWGEHPEELAGEAAADIVLKKPIELLEVEKHVCQLLGNGGDSYSH